MKKSLLTLLSLGILANVQAQIRRPLGPPVNSPQFNEYAPSISANNKTMIFETDRAGEGKWELYYTTKNEKNKWTPPKPIVNINKVASENDLIGGPSISYDGKTLFFFSSFDGGQGDMDIYHSTWDGTDWSSPKPVGNNINTKAYEGFPSVSADGKTLYFIRDNFSKRKDKALCYTIWSSKKQEDGTWGVAEKLPAPINGDCEKSPRIMADNRTLIFSSVRKDGVGGFDLYQSFQEDDGTWATPVNLEYINTEEDDQFASVSAAGDLMYYYTAGDIYTVTIPDKYRKYKLVTVDGKVIDAITKQPIATKITSKSNNAKEKAISTVVDANGLFSMIYRVGSKYDLTTSPLNDYFPYRGSMDMSTAKETDNIEKNIELIPKKIPYQFQLLDKETKAILKDPKVKVMDVETKQLLDVKVEKEIATVTVEIGKQYKFAANALGYAFFSRAFKPDTADVFKDRLKKVPLAILKKDAVVQLQDITFETGKAELKPESNEELDRLVSLLEGNQTIKVEISAHTDDVGNDDSNLKLSEKRAKTVVDYLTTKGIKVDRMTAKGYGETQPLVPNDTDENKAKNRRVQFKIN
ncbi:WD40 repeat protein [Arcicella aurantiaca]|uniref:WD40 repeat protein n=1 Tax=Arcicella aurantiaca TaxID=591202 RepID=A0A316EAA6_9BACT|nr:OmpA family protein [Arcicella aurantiaca]PWK26269.1 WD40 repeat protein [Arcicella aurantiaca]